MENMQDYDDGTQQRQTRDSFKSDENNGKAYVRPFLRKGTSQNTRSMHLLKQVTQAREDTYQ